LLARPAALGFLIGAGVAGVCAPAFGWRVLLAGSATPVVVVEVDGGGRSVLRIALVRRIAQPTKAPGTASLTPLPRSVLAYGCAPRAASWLCPSALSGRALFSSSDTGNRFLQPPPKGDP
jgi:hypothetical protein